MMRILVAVDDGSDPRVVGAYLAERFGTEDIDLDLLIVKPHSRKSAYADPLVRGDLGRYRQQRSPAHEEAQRMLSKFAAELRSGHGFASIRTYVEEGEVTDTVLSMSRRLNSTLLVIEAPKRRRLLTGFRADEVEWRLVSEARCPVELLRPHARSPRSLFNVLVPIGFDQLENFPYLQLANLPWQQGSRIWLLGVLPPTLDDSRVEASPASVISSINAAQVKRLAFANRLREACARLEDELGDWVEIDYELAEGNSREIIVDRAWGAYASLIVVSSAQSESATRGHSAMLSPQSVASSAYCSVLVLRTPVSDAAGRSEEPSAHIAPSHRPA